MRIANVIVEDYPFQEDAVFPYEIPENLPEDIQFGSLLLVPFGLHNQPRLGFVRDLTVTDDLVEGIKPVHQVITLKTISRQQFKTMKSIAVFHQLPFSKLLSWCGLFPKQAQPKPQYFPSVDSETSLIGFRDSKALYRYLKKHLNGLDPVLFKKRFHLTKNTTILKKLENRALIQKKYCSPSFNFQTRDLRIPDSGCWAVNGCSQEDRIEQYIRFIRDYQIKKVLLISPNQSTQRDIQKQLGQVDLDALVFYGSKQDLLKYQPPWDLIIIENSTSLEYQLDMPFSFHHEKVAYIRSRIEGFHLILGSYLPSLFCYQKIDSGACRHLSFTIKSDLAVPKIIIRSMNQEIQKHGFHFIPFSLQGEIDRIHQSGKKTLLLLNRKGYANILHCQHCSSLVVCQKCGSPMMLLSDKKTSRCKNCGYNTVFSPFCTQCGQGSVRMASFGTEKLEEEALNRFPYLSIVRIDKNQAGLKQEDINQADLIIGTTLTLNRVCWKEIEFCCVLGIDARMNYPVYHNQADIFFLFSHLSEKLISSENMRKRILVFSFTPMAEIFQWLIPSKIHTFYENELRLRKELHYPPFTHLMEWKIQASELTDLKKETESLQNFFSSIPGKLTMMVSHIEKIHDTNFNCRIQFKTNDLWNLYPYFRVKIDELKKNEKIVLDVKKWEW